LVRYPPQIFHPRNDILPRLHARRKLRVENELRCAEFSCRLDVLANLLETLPLLDRAQLSRPTIPA
jgi:hypothetical protein